MAVITISRQFGAGGLTLGRLISEKLEYAIYDEELIRLVAEKANVSEDWVESLEKEAGGRFHRFLSGVVPRSLMDRILDDNHGYIDEEIYVDLLYDIIRRIAREDNALIVGRGGQYILRDQPNTYHVLLIADKKDRIAFMEKHYELDHGEALNAVEVEDRRRINLYRKFGKTDYDQPSLYHAVLNMSRLDLNTACDMVLQMLEKN